MNSAQMLWDIISELLENEDKIISETKKQIKLLNEKITECEDVRHEIMKKGYQAFEANKEEK